MVVAVPWDGGDAWALVLQPDSDVATLASAVRRLPAGYRFVESFGDVDVTLVYRPAVASQQPIGAVTGAGS